MEKAIEAVYQKTANVNSLRGALQKAEHEQQTAHRHLWTLFRQLPEKGIDPTQYAVTIAQSLPPPEVPEDTTSTSAHVALVSASDSSAPDPPSSAVPANPPSPPPTPVGQLQQPRKTRSARSATKSTK